MNIIGEVLEIYCWTGGSRGRRTGRYMRLDRTTVNTRTSIGISCKSNILKRANPLEEIIVLCLPILHLFLQLGDPIPDLIPGSRSTFSVALSASFAAPFGCFLFGHWDFGIIAVLVFSLRFGIGSLLLVGFWAFVGVLAGGS